MAGELRENTVSSGGADSAGEHITAGETSLEHVLPEL